MECEKSDETHQSIEHCVFVWQNGIEGERMNMCAVVYALHLHTRVSTISTFGLNE